MSAQNGYNNKLAVKNQTVVTTKVTNYLLI